jgi:hypothetical protein
MNIFLNLKAEVKISILTSWGSIVFIIYLIIRAFSC